MTKKSDFLPLGLQSCELALRGLQSKPCVWCDSKGHNNYCTYDEHGIVTVSHATCDVCGGNGYHLEPCSAEVELAAVLHRVSELEAEVESLLARADELL